MDKFLNALYWVKSSFALQRILKGLLSFFRMIIFLIGIILIVSWLEIPNVKRLRFENPSETAMMRFRIKEDIQFGNRASRIQSWVSLNDVSPYLIQAVVLSEDIFFYQHFGLSLRSIRRAIRKNLKDRSLKIGGSTITQQVAKNLFLNPSKNIIRKVHEAMIACRLEGELAKERILEIYLNTIEWGPGIYGVEAASRYHFHKSASNLNLSEAIRLATIIPNPRKFAPYDEQNQYLCERRGRIAYLMLRYGLIDCCQYLKVLQELHIPFTNGINYGLVQYVISNFVIFRIC